MINVNERKEYNLKCLEKLKENVLLKSKNDEK